MLDLIVRLNTSQVCCRFRHSQQLFALRSLRVHFMARHQNTNHKYWYIVFVIYYCILQYGPPWQVYANDGDADSPVQQCRIEQKSVLFFKVQIEGRVLRK